MNLTMILCLGCRNQWGGMTQKKIINSPNRTSSTMLFQSVSRKTSWFRHWISLGSLLEHTCYFFLLFPRKRCVISNV